MTRARKDYLLAAPDDGLPVQDVGSWAAEKYRRLGMYAEIFSTAMKKKWDTRVYLDLFAGPGHVRLRGSGKRVLSSPLIALSVPDRFDKYIFSDAKREWVNALHTRAATLAPEADVHCVLADVNASPDDITRHIPRHSRSNTVLNFCFADPFSMKINFETIRALGAHRAMDFLLLLAFGMDAKRNWGRYLEPANPTIDRFLGDPAWRCRWAAAEESGWTVTRFLAEEYARAMTALGYLTSSLDQMIPVRSSDKNLPLYYLAFFSKAKLGYKLWKQVQKYSADQLPLM